MMSLTNINHPPSITGISLIIDSEGGTTQSLEFHKAKTRVVNIGRKSGPAKELFTAECDKALFKCPVISRKHAKITFTEYGNVYITDLDSHHGTYLLKPGEAVHKILTPEVPYFISDGDVITFGKTVGKDQSLVRPVCVSVKMQYAPHLTPTAHPLEPVRDVTVISDDSDEASPKLSPNPSPKSSTGRYGVFPPSPDQNSSSSDGESDMEVSPPPSDKSQERPVCGGYESRLMPPSRLLTNYFSLPKQRPLPPIIIAPSPPLSPRRAWEEDPESEMDIEDGQSDAYSPTPSPHPPSDEALDKFTVTWPIPSFPANLFDIQRIVDRSHTRSEDDAIHHMVMGPYSFDEDMRRHVQFPGLPMPQASSFRPEGLANLSDDSAAPLHPLLPCTTLMPPMFGALPLPVDVAPEINAGPTSQAEETMSSPQTNVPLSSTVPATTNDVPVENNSQVPDVIPPAEVESRDAPQEVLIVNAQPIVNSTPEVTEQQDNADPVISDENHTPEHPLVSVSSGDTYIETGDQEKDLVTAIVVRKQTEEDMATDVAAIKSARAEVEQLVSQLKAQVMAQASTSSLKRKRDDVESIDEEQAPSLAGTRGVSAIDLPKPAVRGTKRRRTMKVISVVAQTTAIAAIGAVAAWSALAFA